MDRAVTIFILAAAILSAAAAQTPLEPPAILVYTDKTIYKQGETVTITVEALDETLQPAPGKPIIITVTDPDREVILDNAVRTDENGVAEIVLQLSENSADGEYLIEAVDGENVFTPSVTTFSVCGACRGVEAVNTTITSTVTTTTATTTTTTQTVTSQTTATVTELILTRDALLTAILAVIAAIFVVQILVVRRISHRSGSQPAAQR
ncbi:MAG: MG2 domain-containing protein [Nitrososphaerota archaeon]